MQNKGQNIQIKKQDKPDTLGRLPDHPDKEWNRGIVRTIWLADREYQGVSHSRNWLRNKTKR